MCVWYHGGRHTTKCEDRQQYVSVQLSGMAGADPAADGAATLDLQGSGQAASSREPVFNAVTIWVYSDSEGEEAADSAQDATAGGEPVPMDVTLEPEPPASDNGTAEAASSGNIPNDTSGSNGSSSAGLQTFYSAQGSAIPAVFEAEDVDLDAMD